jgi:uncharacterized protein with ParB-like and HNH nuclease domain
MKTETKIGIIAVEELLDRSFIVPKYQRGYKWTAKKVEDLLGDLEDYMSSPNGDEFYCLQPLAVRPSYPDSTPETLTIDPTKLTETEALEDIRKLYSRNTVWEVIDGQQRLTTMYIILKYLDREKDLYSLKYETREGSGEFLKDSGYTDSERSKLNSDYYHMHIVYNAIDKWMKERSELDKQNLLRTIYKKARFIWYETSEDPIKVFTRLNIGKISLTNSELIKTLILNRIIDDKKDYEIAHAWDRIEQTLQNDEFWYFIQDTDYNKATRIDYLFDFICENERDRKLKEIIGNDQYRTFRYYDLKLKGKDPDESNEKAEKAWDEVLTLYEVLLEWYNDLEFYHYIGFILCHNRLMLRNIYKEWNSNNNKTHFTKFLKDQIKGILKNIAKRNTGLLDVQYEIEDNQPKTMCRPILLLHNIQTVINQNRKSESEDIFKHVVFYKFPFYLYKKEKWDVEHIDSNTTNNLKDNFSKLLWLLQYKDQFKNSDVYNNIITYLKGNAEDKIIIKEAEIKKLISKYTFEEATKLMEAIVAEDKSNTSDTKLDLNLKNQIGNFTLLDASTNRGYGNSIFHQKRRVIMAKDRRQSYQLQLEKLDSGVWEFKDVPVKNEEVSAFIPPVTRNVFMKYYSPQTDFNVWNKDDFNGYKEDIKELLSEFLKNEEQYS